jgi:hypothetical protein
MHIEACRPVHLEATDGNREILQRISPMERREALGLRSQGGPRAPDQASQPWSESGAHERVSQTR